MNTITPATLKSLPMFHDCPAAVLARLLQGAGIEQCAKGRVLFLNGEPANSYFYIRSGWIKLFRETLDGDQAIVDILPAGHLFGETAIFENGIYAYSAEMVEEGEVARLPLRTLQDEIDRNHALALAMLKSMSRYRHEQEMEIEHRTLQSAPQRIGCFLLRLMNQHDSGPVTVHLPYDKTLLAARLGMQPETFSRALARLKKETGLEIRGSTVQARSFVQLSEYACAACSSGFPCADK
ncbi:MAG: Crp/Fnr family transcriptional regulator [Rhodospirillales bacterium]|nr:Crp/Fnr family transcriptional regulator [Alphaproteobacteria bacterium]MCB9986823.1 Crp/Fnr family transcriptional regulator [Rhodospirillales bacterium]USO08413.1 MAG: Crp/Fnr family transcriptional regulator [Rhodospirillales bacterium]